mmetsp:Transcript_10863/g.28095  ORF Transcript_10863/g.28095 Transcript_10863/m.28095 type:complete len:547 (+) Transcript_10863:89-1729(+)
MAAPTEASLLSEKCKRFGLLGAGLVCDSMMTLRLAEVRAGSAVRAESAAESTRSAEAASVGYALASPSSAPSALGPSNGAAAIRAPVPAAHAVLGPATVVANGQTLTRQEILDILSETVRVQGIVQQEVSVLARKIAKESKKKKKGRLTFLDGHKKILELNLPKEPLEERGLTESAFQKILNQYEEDDEVMTCAQQLLHPAGKGDPERAAGITMDRIVEIHKFMVTEMQKVLQEFLELSQDVRRTFTGKGCETTAELLVSIAVEQVLSVRCEDVEQAVIRYEEPLQSHPEFTRYTEQLANMMSHLIGATQPRVEKAEFVQLLQQMGDSTKKFKTFSKQVYEDYRSKACTIVEAYRRFDEFTEQNAGPDAQEAQEMPDLSSVEMQLCYDEYRDDEEVRRAWDHSGAETTLMMQSVLSPSLAGNSRSVSSSSAADERKVKKLKSSEVVEMQELMVDEIRRTTQALKTATMRPGERKPEIAMQLVQALASAAVERRFGISAEEMAVASFQHAAVLQKNERLARASEEQQDILMQLARSWGQALSEAEGE